MASPPPGWPAPSWPAGPPRPTPAARPGDVVHPFRGAHQAGIVTPAQDRLHFAAFDVTTSSRAQLVALLQGLDRGRGPDDPRASTPARSARWTAPDNLPPDDTGEALGLPSGGLTITFGFGPGLFRDADGRDRFGLADRRPAALEPLPHFPGDTLDPARSDGDLCVQACADDPQVAVHAIRNLARIGFGTVSVRWSQLGFGRTSTTSTAQSTPRNLFGFKDGTANVKAEETDRARGAHLGRRRRRRARRLAGRRLLPRRAPDQHGHRDLGPAAARRAGGDVGRTKGTGAPLSGRRRAHRPDFAMPGSDGPVIPADAHVRVVHPDQNGGARMLRRGYNFVDGTDALGSLNAGLFFLAYVRDPRTDFIPVQNRMARSDTMMEYLKVTGSALFAVPPGIGPGEHVGQSLFA